MLKIRVENVLEKMFVVLSVSLLVQLMCTIGTSHQMSIASETNDRPMIAYGDNFHKDFHLRDVNESVQPSKNKLKLSDRVIDILMKKFSENPKLQEYLKVLKKKNKFEAEEEEPNYDYQYQTKFRF